MSYFNALFYMIGFLYYVSELERIFIWGKYLWNVYMYLFQNYNLDDHEIRDRQSLKLP